MPALFPFTGARLSLQSVQFLTPLRLRIRFTTEPVQTNPAGGNDALNPANYQISGPGVAAVTQLIPVPGDKMSFWADVSAPMLTGVWTLTVSNIQTPTASALVSPTVVSFTSTYLVSTDTNPGAIQQGAYQLLRKHLNSVFVGPKWTALLAAIASEDDRIFASARSAFDQMFVTTASGIFLRDRAGDRGVAYPTGVGLSDVDFRSLITAISNEKITEESFLQVLEVFFGKEKLRAWAETESSGPWSVTDGATLQISIDSQPYTIIFRDEDFLSPTAATAAEIASAITRQLKILGCQGWAEFTPTSEIRLFSPSKGLGSTVEILGGTAQDFLRFPSVILTNTVGPSEGVVIGDSWVVSEPRPGVMRLRLTSAVSTVNLFSATAGGYLLIKGSGFATINRGSWPIVSVDVRTVGGSLQQTVEVTNTSGIFPQAGVTITAADDLLFFAPFRATQTDVTVAHAIPGTAEITVPATAAVVARSSGRAAYLQAPTVFSISSAKRVYTGVLTVDVGETHGLSPNSWVMIDDFVPDHQLPAPSISGLPTLPSSPVSFLSEGTPDVGHFLGTSLTLSDGQTVFSSGGVSGASTTTAARRWTTTAYTEVDGARKYDEVTPATAVSPVAVYLQASSLLADGRVLVTGGRPASTGDVTDLTSCYNPTTNSWTTPGKLKAARAWHFQISLQDGRVLVGGGASGLPGSIVTLSSCEYFTYNGSGGGTWTVTSSMSVARIGAAAVLLQDGRVLVCGGNTSTVTNYLATNFDQPTNSVEIFDPATNTWSTTGSMNLHRTRHDAVVLPDGRVLVVGGATAEPNAPTTVSLDRTGGEIWDPTTGRWSRFQTPFARVWVRLLSDPTRARVYAVSGYNTSGFGAEIWYLDVKTMVWHACPSVYPNGSAWSSLGMRADGSFFLVSGAGDSGFLTSKYLFIPGSDFVSARNINGAFKVVSVPTPSSFTVQTSVPAYTLGTSGTVMPLAAPASAFKGPYIVDPLSFTLGAASSISTTALHAGRGNQTLTLADSSSFPSSGWVVLSFGEFQTGLLRYLSKRGNDLLLDASTSLEFDFPAGVGVSSVSSLEAATLALFAGAFFLTGGTQGRIAAINLLEKIKAAGLPLVTTIVFPGDRGLGGEGRPTSGAGRLSDAPIVWGGDED